MGFNNGYDSGYSDCETENRKKWEEEAIERYKAENPPSGGSSGGGSPATPRNPVVMLKDCPVTAYGASGTQVSLFTVDASNLTVGEAIFVDGTDATAPAEVDTPLPMFKILVPTGTTNAYDTLGVGELHPTSTPCTLQTDGDVKSFSVGVGTTMNASVKPCGLIVRTSETVIYFAATSADTE